MKVVFAREAIEDLVAIGEYISKSNLARSESFVDELEEKCLQLVDTPVAFIRIGYRTDRHIRRRPYGQYLILYEIGAHQIDVLRIVHGAQDYEKILFPSE